MSLEEIVENTFTENKRPEDKPLTIAHQDQYNEGRCTVAQLKLNTILGITYPQVPVTKAIMCSDPKSGCQIFFGCTVIHFLALFCTLKSA